MRNLAYAFFALAAAFIVLGLTSNRTFLFVGLVFIVVGVLRLLPRR